MRGWAFSQLQLRCRKRPTIIVRETMRKRPAAAFDRGADGSKKAARVSGGRGKDGVSTSSMPSDAPSMPKLGVELTPLQYRGCIIYVARSQASWRVMPKVAMKPGSHYDKAFPFGIKPQVQWQNVVRYCANPIVPPAHRK